MVQEYNIDGLDFRFFNLLDDNIGAIVKDEDGIMKTRAFRKSGSDHQFKSVPGMEEFRYIKGCEGDPNNHYVQSGKLDPRVYEILSDLSEKKTPRNNFKLGTSSLVSYIDENRKSLSHKGWEKFEFSEKQHEFKDEEWNRIRQHLTKDFKDFMDIKQYGRTRDSSKKLSEEEYAKKFDYYFVKSEKKFSLQAVKRVIIFVGQWQPIAKTVFILMISLRQTFRWIAMERRAKKLIWVC